MTTGGEAQKNPVDLAVKTFASFGGFLYVLGFLVSCLHYARYGILAIDFISPHYVLVGALCLGSFAIFLWLDHFAQLPMPERREYEGKPWLARHACIAFWFIARISIYLLGFWVGIGMVGLALVFLAIAVGDELAFDTVWSIIVAPLLLMLVARGILYLGTRVAEASWSKQLFLDREDRTESLTILLGCAVLVLTYISIYTLFIHDCIPASIGGGKFGRIELFLSEHNANADLRTRLKLPQSGPARTRPLRLVRETTDNYFLLLSYDPSKVLVLPKSATDGVIITYGPSEIHKTSSVETPNQTLAASPTPKSADK